MIPEVLVVTVAALSASNTAVDLNVAIDSPSVAFADSTFTMIFSLSVFSFGFADDWSLNYSDMLIAIPA